MKEHPKNPNAFPVTYPRSQDGMSLRDYFAARAMEACIISAGGHANFDPEKLSTTAYKIADAMLSEREKQ